MNILTKKNGLALVAVMVLLMVLTLLVPAMFTYADTATSTAVKGSDRQKAAYLARTGVEMAVATFKKTYDDGNEDVETEYEAVYRRLGGDLKTGETALTKLNSDTVYLYIDTNTPVPSTIAGGASVTFPENYYDSVYTTNSATYKNNPRYIYVGKVDVAITRVNETKVFKIMSDGQTINISENPAYAADFAEACDSDLTKPIKASGTDDYSYVKQSYAQFDFVATAEVNGVKATKKASALDTIDTKDNGWLSSATAALDLNESGTLTLGKTGYDMIAVDPDKATSKQQISYKDKAVGVNTQDVLIYSTYGNVIIDSNVTYPTKKELNDGAGMQLTQSNYDAMVSTMPVYLGCEPSINYYEKMSKGNLSNTITSITFKTGVKNTFVCFTTTNAIQVNLPVNMTINPCRNETVLGFVDKQQSVYKMMLFQSNDIIFKQSIVNFMSFAKPEDFNLTDIAGKRYGSVVLAATETTPYSYYNISRGKIVKAGRVTFLDDVYLVYIQYGDNSGKTVALSDEVYGNWNKLIYTHSTGLENSRSEYKASADGKSVTYKFPVSNCKSIKNYLGITKYGYYITKLFNKGDVYLFNAEVEAKGTDGKMTKVGLNLAGWWVESYYINNMSSEARTLYQLGTYAAFSYLYDEGKLVYKYDDMHYMGNVYEDIAYPEDLSTMCYIVWDS